MDFLLVMENLIKVADKVSVELRIVFQNFHLLEQWVITKNGSREPQGISRVLVHELNYLNAKIERVVKSSSKLGTCSDTIASFLKELTLCLTFFKMMSIVLPLDGSASNLLMVICIFGEINVKILL